jgi:hypothetical protein
MLMRRVEIVEEEYKCSRSSQRLARQACRVSSLPANGNGLESGINIMMYEPMDLYSTFT